LPKENLVPPTAAPSAPLLLFLFADKFVPAASRLTGAHEVPCRNVKAALNPLADLMLAVGFWSLRQQGIIQIEPLAKKKMLVMNTTVARVTTLRSAPAPGLEGYLLGAVNSVNGQEVFHAVHSLWPGDVTWPHKELVAMSAPEASALGLEQFGAYNCAAIAPLEGYADSLLAHWNAFMANEAVLHKAILDGCKAGLRSRTESTSDGGDSGGFSSSD
jgi:hypothetical protein